MQALLERLKRPVYLAFFCSALAGSLLLHGCDRSTPIASSIADDYHLLSGTTMGTTYSIKAQLELNADPAQLQAAIEKQLQEINQQMSTYIDDSELNVFNRSAPNVPHQVSAALREVMAISLLVSEQSSGAFDVTVGPLVNLWGFGPIDVDETPSDEEIAAALGKMGYQYLVLQHNTLQKNADIAIDLSAIAKGYAVDVLGDLLESRGVHNYMVEIGGELKLKGMGPSGHAWRIGIEKPALGREGALEVINGDNIAIATSGDYRNFYEKDGVRVSHTINPQTGRPITHSLASVTVVTESAAYADAYATALNVLGPKRGFALAEQLDLAAFFIIRDEGEFDVNYTSAFEQYRVH